MRSSRFASLGAVLVLGVLLAAIIAPAVALATAPSPVSGYTRYEESSPFISYTGSWYTSLFNAIYSGGYEKYSPPPPWTGSGGDATFYFKGTDFMWLAPMNNVRGIAKITVDNGTPDFVDCYSASNDVYVVNQVHGLANQQHKVVIEWTGTKNPSSTYALVSIDALDVKGAASSGASTITASAGSGGSISSPGATAVPWNGSQSYTISTSPGYVVSDVLVNGSSVGAVSSYTFNNVTSDQIIAVSFRNTVITPAASTWSLVLAGIAGLGFVAMATRRRRLN